MRYIDGPTPEYCGQSPKKSRKIVLVIVEELNESLIADSDIWARIQRIRAVSDMIVITGSPHLRESLNGSRVLVLPRGNRRGGSSMFFVCSWLLTMIVRHDLLYLAEIGSAPSVLFARKSRVICYGNTHLAQKFAREEGHRSLSSRALKLIFMALSKAALKRVRSILAISPQLKDAYIAFGLDPDSIKVQGIGVNISLFKPGNSKPNDVFRCAYTGDITPTRGAIHMTEALEMVSRTLPGFRMRFVGIAEDAKWRLAKELGENGFSQNVEFVGRIPHSRVPDYLADCHIGISLLSPTDYFSCSPPTKIFEYLAAGLPVVANRIQTHADYVIHERNGLLVDLNSRSIAEAVLRLAQDRQFLASLSRQAVKDAAVYNQSTILDTFSKEFS